MERRKRKVEELSKLEFESDEIIRKVKKHPITKIALIVGGSIAALYLTSYVLKAASKAAESWRELSRTFND